jgi:PKD-like domain/Glycine rich protein/Secretion system C-terminal sorting domain
MKKIYLAIAILAGANSLNAQSVTYSYTGSVQTFTVPTCVTSISVDVIAGSGGNNGSYIGGNGGRVQATVPVTPGEVLQIYVGAVGANTQVSHPGVYGGGGAVYSYVSGGTAGTGGGATDIRRTPYNLSDRLVVAGGGGGGGYITIGGHGGGLIGQDGVPYPSFPNSGGKGGSQIAGGQQGVACCSCPTYTTAGSSGQGGNGAGDGAGGGGGGGGYFGGGGSCFAGGGGGSSYTAPTVTGVTHTQGFNSGNGQVIISYTAGGSIPTTPTGITGGNSICAGSTASFSISPVGGATSYTWTVPSGSVITSGQGTTSINVTFGLNSGNVTVTADNSCGSSAAAVSAITVNALPVVALGADATYCASTVLDAGNAGAAYSWNTGGTSQTITVTATGLYQVSVTNSLGCTASDTINVTINALPAVTLGNDIVQCGGSVVLDAGSNGSTYFWSDASTAQTLTVASSGAYSVTVTDANSCSNSDTINVTIHPAVNVSASAPSANVCLADAPLSLTGTPSGGTWNGPGVAGNQFNPSVAGAGTHTLIYSYTDSLTSCSDTAQVQLMVDICLNTTDDLNINQITVYPNPVTDEIRIQSSSVLTSYVITDITGREVLSGRFVAGQPITINTGSLKAGTYILNTVNGSGTTNSTQFIKQ